MKKKLLPLYIAIIGLALLVGAAACDMSKTDEGDTFVPPGPPPSGYIVVQADIRISDCEAPSFIYDIKANVHGGVPTGGTLSLEYGDGTSDTSEGIDFSGQKTYRSCGAGGEIGYKIRGTYTYHWSDGHDYQVFGDKSVDPCASCFHP